MFYHTIRSARCIDPLQMQMPEMVNTQLEWSPDSSPCPRLLLKIAFETLNSIRTLGILTSSYAKKNSGFSSGYVPVLTRPISFCDFVRFTLVFWVITEKHYSGKRWLGCISSKFCPWSFVLWHTNSTEFVYAPVCRINSHAKQQNQAYLYAPEGMDYTYRLEVGISHLSTIQRRVIYLLQYQLVFLA